MNLIYYFLALILLLLYFYRKPQLNQTIYDMPANIITSPAYGTIKKIVINNDNIHIIIVLSLLDIHYQYYPTKGRVVDAIYDTTGKYELAQSLNKSNDNEKMITTLNTKIGNIKIIQIAGKFVRRIKNNNDINKYVKTGQMLGMIKFGSRVDIILPKNKFQLLVKNNQYVNGPNTILGYYN